MAFVPVPKDLNRVKTKVMFNLTKRQLICFSIAAAVGVPIFFLAKAHLDLSTAAMLMVVIICLLYTSGRPVSRYLDDGFTLEVTRLCTNGAKNACSFLYGAAARAAAAMGYKRIITYTLESENGASLRASGWICQGKAGGLRWTGKRQPKEDQYPAQMKLRYEKQLRKEETVNGICSGPEGS